MTLGIDVGDMPVTGLPPLPAGEVWWIGERHSGIVIAIKFAKQRWFGRGTKYTRRDHDGYEWSRTLTINDDREIKLAADTLLSSREEHNRIISRFGYYPPKSL